MTTSTYTESAGQYLTVFKQRQQALRLQRGPKTPLQRRSQAPLLFLVSCCEFGVQCRCRLARFALALQLKVSYSFLLEVCMLSLTHLRP